MWVLTLCRASYLTREGKKKQDWNVPLDHTWREKEREKKEIRKTKHTETAHNNSILIMLLHDMVHTCTCTCTCTCTYMYSACTCITHAQYLESLQWKLYLLNSVEQSQEGALNRGRLAEATCSTCIYCRICMKTLPVRMQHSCPNKISIYLSISLSMLATADRIRRTEGGKGEGRGTYSKAWLASQLMIDYWRCCCSKRVGCARSGNWSDRLDQQVTAAAAAAVDYPWHQRMISEKELLLSRDGRETELQYKIGH